MNERPSVLVTVGVVAVAVVVWLLVDGSSGPDTTGAMFSTGDRDAPDAAPVGRDAAPVGRDAAAIGRDAAAVGRGAAAPIDPRDAEAVRRAYGRAAYSLVAGDAGGTNRRAVGYATPDTPPNEIGVLALDPPPAGRRNDAVVTDVRQAGGEPTGTRRGYVVGYHEVQLAADAADPTPDDTTVSTTPRLTRYLLLTRRPDGRWRVASDTTDAEAGAP